MLAEEAGNAKVRIETRVAAAAGAAVVGTRIQIIPLLAFLSKPANGRYKCL
jgi:hypothetical protein